MGWSFGWNTRKSLIENLTTDTKHENSLTHTICIKHCVRGTHLWSVWSRELNPKAVELFNVPLDEMPMLLSSEVPYESLVSKHRLEGGSLESLREEIKLRYVHLSLMQYNRRDGWGYKGMDESAGPYTVHTCPISYLDIAQPAPSDEYSQRWRQNVKDYYAEKRAYAAAKKAHKDKLKAA